jgi:hypothetical protein
LPGRYALIRANAAEAQARRDEYQEQEKLSRLQTQIELPKEVREVYSQLLDAFAIVAKSECKWDTLSRIAVDRVRERTTAWHHLDRRAVTFNLGSCDLIESEWSVPHLANANGGDLYIYPGFILMLSSGETFALVDVNEIAIDSDVTRFIEEETVPSDTKIVEQTWKKANLDGSADRRFANNYQIPVVEYGRLTIASSRGLNEEYMISNYGAVTQFVSAWKTFQQAVGRYSPTQTTDTAKPPSTGQKPNTELKGLAVLENALNQADDLIARLTKMPNAADFNIRLLQNVIAGLWGTLFASAIATFVTSLETSCQYGAIKESDQQSIKPLLDKWTLIVHSKVGSKVDEQRFQSFQADLKQFSEGHPQWLANGMTLDKFFEQSIWEAVFKPYRPKFQNAAMRLERLCMH